MNVLSPITCHVSPGAQRPEVAFSVIRTQFPTDSLRVSPIVSVVPVPIGTTRDRPGTTPVPPNSPSGTTGTTAQTPAWLASSPSPPTGSPAGSFSVAALSDPSRCPSLGDRLPWSCSQRRE